MAVHGTRTDVCQWPTDDGPCGAYPAPIVRDGQRLCPSCFLSWFTAHLDAREATT